MDISYFVYLLPVDGHLHLQFLHFSTILNNADVTICEKKIK